MSDLEDIDLNSQFDFKTNMDAPILKCLDNLPETPVYPSEVNSFFKERIQLLTQQNGYLQQNLSKANDEIAELTQKAAILNEQLNSKNSSALGKGSDFIGSRIIDLSKKNRQLYSELETYKSKCGSLENKLLQSISDKTVIKCDIVETKSEAESHTESLVCEIAELKEKLNGTMQKLFETKNQNQKLKSEIKVAHKCLSNEVGESVSVQSLLNQPAGWRGRSQQIIMLQSKVAELQEKCNSQNNGDTGLDMKSQIALKQAEIQLKISLESATKELKETKSTCEDYKNKLNVARARCKMLESECAAHKIKIQTLLEKTAHDNQFIQALNTQLSKKEETYSKDLDEKLNALTKAQRTINDLQLDVAKWELRMEQTNRLMEEKDKCIEKLKQLQTNQELQIQYDCDIKAYEAEKNKFEELVTILNKRLEVEQNKCISLTKDILKERNKCGKLENQVARLNGELNKRKLNRLTDTRQKYSINKSTSATNLTNSNLSNTSPDSVSGTSGGIDALSFICEDLKNKLEIAAEQNMALEERVEALYHEKQCDFTYYKSMIDKVRENFRNTTIS